MLNEQDNLMLRRAIRLAMRGRGTTEPNPSVGCVLTLNGQVIGEGHTQPYGGAHAEPTALAACVADGHSPAGATAYVTLEPCCHLDKQTPPCAPRLIAAKIARVVIGCLDPTSQVNGNGVAMLRAAGVQVDLASPGVEAESKQLIAPFIARTIFHRPYITLKWAQSRNGKVAGPMGQRVKITNASSDQIIHAMRGRCDAIAVGTNTVLNDDPLLTVRRSTPSPRLPMRVVLSNTLKLPLASKLIATARTIPLIVYCSESSAATNESQVEALRAAGAEVISLPDHDSHFSFADVMHNLFERRVTHLLIEPGPTLARSLIARGQFDRIWRFISPNDIVGMSAAPLVDGLTKTGSLNLGGDELTEFLNPKSDCFFNSSASSDFVYASEQRV